MRVLVKFLHLICEHIQMLVAPEIFAHAHLITKIVQELSRVRNLLPDLRKESATVIYSIAQDDAIHMWSYFG